MAAGKVRSAKKRRFIHNTIVHVVLAILALIWVFPILWADKLPGREGVLCFHFLPTELYTG